MRKVILLSVMMLFIASCGLIPPIPNGGGEMGNIGWNGEGQGTGFSGGSHYWTNIIPENPATITGIISKIYIDVMGGVEQEPGQGELDDLKIATFYKTGESTYSVRDYQLIGTLTAGYHEIDTAIAVKKGDLLGYYFSLNTASPAMVIDEGKYMLYVRGDFIPGTDIEFDKVADGLTVFIGGIIEEGYIEEEDEELIIEIGYPNPKPSDTMFGLSEIYGTIFVLEDNPSDKDGTITSIALSVSDSIDDLIVATFEKDAGDYFKVRDYNTVNVEGGSSVVPVQIDVKIGDYLGVVIPAGSEGTFYEMKEGGSGFWHGINDNNILDGSYHYLHKATPHTDMTLSIKGIGIKYASPKVRILTPTNILSNEIKARGNILSDYFKTIIERGFQYDITKNTINPDSTSDSNNEIGLYDLPVTGLQAKTSYWIRAYAVNSEGTGYSDWIQFQTASKGIIPTGTKLNICSDYSGYTYQLMRSEFDDGEAYTAYFAIATDLANTQGLPFYKRILDLHLYFNRQDDGKCKVFVKCDTEPEWQYVDEVELTGIEDIVIKHIPTDIRGKHFQFKLEGSNHFEFLGVLVEYLPQGKR